MTKIHYIPPRRKTKPWTMSSLSSSEGVTVCGLEGRYQSFSSTRSLKEVTCQACKRTIVYREMIDEREKRNKKRQEAIAKNTAKTKQIETYLQDKEYFKTPFSGLEL